MHQARHIWKEKSPYSFTLFVSLSLLLVLIDSILIGTTITYYTILAQYTIITLSGTLFISGFGATRYYFPLDYDVVESISYKRISKLLYIRKAKQIYYTVLKSIERWFYCVDIGTVYECILYVLGYYGLISHNYGLASLRVLRAFRLITYLQYYCDVYDNTDLAIYENRTIN